VNTDFSLKVDKILDSANVGADQNRAIIAAALIITQELETLNQHLRFIAEIMRARR
jgi:cell division protein ZapA (FtsZ GTPase activity inhibitor)